MQKFKEFYQRFVTLHKNLKKRDEALKKFAHYYSKLDKLKREKAAKEQVWNAATQSY
jgi:hypothetical protein